MAALVDAAHQVADGGMLRLIPGVEQQGSAITLTPYVDNTNIPFFKFIDENLSDRSALCVCDQ